ncbi:MAG TPA: hypothetical protein VNU46_05460 [Gemmatimonadaceae bacterium]|nr:hypothetical protein [Gemmatimonadaceae bacterium]
MSLSTYDPIMEDTQHFAALTTALRQFLTTQRYREPCIKKFLHTWAHLQRYMTQGGMTVYSRDVGEAFLTHRFGDIPYTRLKKSQKGIVRHIQALSEYQERGAICRHRTRVPTIVFTGTLGAPFTAFITYARAIKRSESTIPRTDSDTVSGFTADGPHARRHDGGHDGAVSRTLGRDACHCG